MKFEMVRFQPHVLECSCRFRGVASLAVSRCDDDNGSRFEATLES
jgi:hypothetical protein